MNEITTRLAVETDQEHLIRWLMEPGVLEWFPLSSQHEIEDAARLCMSYVKQGAVLTALWNGVPCGMANLYIQPYKKLAHQSLFVIIVDAEYRGKGVGTKLLQDLIELGKTRFLLEIIHLEMCEGNPALGLYQKCGFVEYGRQRHFIKDEGRYSTKIMMQKVL